MLYIPVIIEGCVEPRHLPCERTFDKAIESLVLTSAFDEDTDDSENSTFILTYPDSWKEIEYGKFPELCSFSGESWDTTKNRLLEEGKITQEQWNRLH